jgi:hypothetical protein
MFKLIAITVITIFVIAKYIYDIKTGKVSRSDDD